ncbi:hypothetical protein PybrP1_006608, partial [[Pythium] brassicae (nom. inval.)]
MLPGTAIKAEFSIGIVDVPPPSLVKESENLRIFQFHHYITSINSALGSSLNVSSPGAFVLFCGRSCSWAPPSSSTGLF